MRNQIAFLQTAVGAGIRTLPHFASILKPPFPAVSEPLDIPAYQLPRFDLSRHTPTTWRQEAEEGCKRHRDDLLNQIRVQLDQLVASGQLKVHSSVRQWSQAVFLLAWFLHWDDGRTAISRVRR